MYKGDSYPVTVFSGGTADACDGDKVTKNSVFTITSGSTVINTSVSDGNKRKLTAFSTGSGALSIVYDSLTVPLNITVVKPDEDRWPVALKNSNISVTYNARMIDVGSGRELVDGETVSVGSRVRFEAVPFKNTDISWFGTGMSYDTPYGYWIKDADAPSPFQCLPGDEMTSVDTQRGLAGPTKVFIPFTVDPPRVSFRHAGTATLACVHGGSSCTVTSPGTIRSSVVFDRTFGQFYFRRIMYVTSGYYTYINGLCLGNDIPLSVRFTMNNNTYFSSYDVNVPETIIPFELSAVVVSAPPTIPVVTGPSTTLVSQPNEFIATSTDPDGDTLRYGFDWDKNGTVDQWVPGTGYVASGLGQTAGYTWSSTGSKTFQVLAEDVNGASSAFASYVITVADGNFRVCADVLQINAGQTRDLQLNAIGDTRDLVAYYDTGTGCLGNNVTATTSFVSANPSVVSVDAAGSMPDTKRLTGAAVGGPVWVTATYGIVAPAALNVTVPKVCISGCAEKAGEHCLDTIYYADDSGGDSKPCTGTRACEFNWREVVPGF
jgi:hypothetical protein